MEAGDAPLTRCLGLQFRDEDFVEAGSLLESGKIELERESAELNPKAL